MREGEIKSMREILSRLCLRPWCLALIVFLIPFVSAASDISVFQGQYYENNTLQQGTFNFTFTIYDDATAGAVVYTATRQIQTGTWGQWKVELEGVSASANDASKDYFMEIAIDGRAQGERRRVNNFNYLRKDVNETTNALFTSTRELKASSIGASTHAIIARVAEPSGILIGQPVYPYASLNGTLAVRIARKNDFAKVGVLGLAKAGAAYGEEINIVTRGEVEGLNTFSFQEGDKIYLDDGFISTNPPSRGQGLVEIGVVTRRDLTNGVVLVDKVNRNVVVDKAGAAGFNIVNTNGGQSTSAAINFFNNVGNRFTIFLGSTNSSSNFPNGAVLYNEGAGPMVFTIGGPNPSPFLWRVNTGATGSSAPSFDLMRLMPAGELILYYGGITAAGNITSKGRLVCLEDGTDCTFLSNITRGIDTLNQSFSNLTNFVNGLRLTENDTLQTITSRGATTTNNLTIGQRITFSNGGSLMDTTNSIQASKSLGVAGNINSSGDICTSTTCLNSLNNLITLNLGNQSHSAAPTVFQSTTNTVLGRTTVYLPLGSVGTASTTEPEASWIVDRNLVITKILWNAESNARTDVVITLDKSTTTKTAFVATAGIASVLGTTKGSVTIVGGVSYAEGDLMAIKYSTSNIGPSQVRSLSVTLVGYYA